MHPKRRNKAAGALFTPGFSKRKKREKKGNITEEEGSETRLKHRAFHSKE